MKEMTETMDKWLARFPKDSEFTVFELSNGQKIYREDESRYLFIPLSTKIEKKSRAAIIYQEIIKLQEKRKRYESQLTSLRIKLDLVDEHNKYLNSYYSIKKEILQLNEEIKEYENLL